MATASLIEKNPNLRQFPTGRSILYRKVRTKMIKIYCGILKLKTFKKNQNDCCILKKLTEFLWFRNSLNSSGQVKNPFNN